MIHCFEITVADKFGMECAVILHNLYFWVKTNKANNHNYKDGYYWTYNSVKAFEELFSYLTPHKIRGALKRLEENGVILVGMYNIAKYNRTLWYTLTDEWFEYFEHKLVDNKENETSNTKKPQISLQKNANPFTKKREPIPDINTNINTDNIIMSPSKLGDAAFAPGGDLSKEESADYQAALTLSCLLESEHKQYDPQYKGNPKSWAVDIEKLLRIDKRHPSQVEQVIRWVKGETNFWRANIMSGKKLREKFPALISQMQREELTREETEEERIKRVLEERDAIRKQRTSEAI